jgi:vitamin B12 transporter
MYSPISQALRRLPILLIFLDGALVPVKAQTAAASPPAAPPEAPVTSLGNIDVVASRLPEDPALVPSSETVLTPDELDASQVPDLRTALGQVPGVSVLNTGAPGGSSSVFIRGASSTETLFMVDGIRMNTQSEAASYNSYLGGADLVGLDQIAILRGPQSTLYGSSAMGGVILIDTARGAGPFSGVFDSSFGSFDTVDSSVAVQGAQGPLGYSASVSQEYTDNSRPYNQWDQWNYSTRLEYKVSDILTVGATYRGQDATYEEPSSIIPADVDMGDIQSENELVTTYAIWQPKPEFQSKLTLGWTQNEYQWTDLTYGSSGDFNSLGTREILDWQNTWEPTSTLQVVGGVNAEQSDYLASGQTTTDALRSIYLNTVLHPIKDLELTLGGRGDHYDSVGDAFTWRAGAAYLLNNETTKLHATYGTGFNAPDPVYRLGESPYYVANPDIKPEQSRGWDAGIDQDFFNHQLSTGITYFNNRFRNLFTYQEIGNTFNYEEVNEARAEAQGVEVATAAKLGAKTQVRLTYTYLTGGDPDNDTPLNLQPRHTLDGEVRVQATQAWLIGVGVHSEIDRDSVSSTTVTPMADYTTVRLFTSYEWRKGVIFKLRVENALNDKYQENPGWPALPLGVFGGVELHF